MSSIQTDVVAARGGDPDAFARLVGNHASAVCAITTAILRDADAGEEVGQEVFVCAWQQLHALRDPKRFAPWIRQIARNRAHDRLRSRLGRREIAGSVLVQLPDPTPGVDERLHSERQEAVLWNTLDGLDDDHREVLVLYYREGRSVAQVAAHLGLSESTARKRLSRARARLRDGVEAQLSGEIARTSPDKAAIVAAVAAAVVGLAVPSAYAAPSLPQTLSAIGSGRLAGIGLGAAMLVILSTVTWSPGSLPEIAAPDRIVAASAGGPVEPEPATSPDPASATHVPEHVRLAFLAAEDARFFEHGGLDLYAVGRAVLNNALGDGSLQGASTLTQQLAKITLAEQARGQKSLSDKVRVLAAAIDLERRLSKEQILQRYLDEVYLGSGATGLTEAARRYFDKPVSELTLAEGALLAGLPAAPSAHNPHASPDKARIRRAYVLEQMQIHGWATASEVAAAEAAPLPERER